MAPVRLEIGFPIFAEVTEFDFTGPREVLTRVPGVDAINVPGPAPLRTGAQSLYLPQ